MTTPRYTHAVSLNAEDEKRLQEALRQGKKIIDLLRIGLDNQQSKQEEK